MVTWLCATVMLVLSAAIWVLVEVIWASMEVICEFRFVIWVVSSSVVAVARSSLAVVRSVCWVVRLFSSEASLALAAASVAFADASEDCRSRVPTVASTWPFLTVSPAWTLTAVTVPDTAKSTDSWTAGVSVPVVEIDCLIVLTLAATVVSAVLTVRPPAGSAVLVFVLVK